MNNPQRTARQGAAIVAASVVLAALTGCGPNYRDLRLDGQRAMLRADYMPARYFFEEADKVARNRPENLHDLGFCSFMLAKELFDQSNRAAALRELDLALEFYTRAIDSHPGHYAATVGKNLALELKGRPDQALAHAEWAAKIIGPAARQHLFLAEELEERGDLDAALLRYRQAVAIEPGSATAHVEIAKFLLRHQNEEAAVWHLQKAYRINPRDQWVAGELTSRGKLPPLARTERQTP